MKEETPLEPQIQQQTIYRAQLRSIEPSNPACEWPCPRFKHQTFLYRDKLYLHGGTTIPAPEFSDDPLDLFCFTLEGETAGKWQKLRTKVSGGKELQTVSAHAAVLNGNKWYTFGGSNCECKPNNVLLRLNIESLEWTRLQQKGEVPSARECAHLSFLQKNWLVLYGGISTAEVDIYNSFHFYNIDTRNWSSCEGAYQFQIYPRMDPAICHFKDKLYLFGGSYRSLSNNEERHLDDFYEIAVSLPGRNLGGRVQVRRLAGLKVPQGRSGHSLLGVGQHHLMLLGGESTSSQMREGVRFEDVSLVQNMWLFDTRTSVWGRVQLPDRSLQYRTMTSCSSLDNKLYVFGGLHSYSSVLKDLLEITIDSQQLSQPRSRIVACPECQQRQRFPPTRRHIAASIIQDIAEGIDFPFAAVGLLIDNSMNSGASLLKISYFHQYGSQKIRFIKFEDDARLNWSDEQLFETLAHFNAGMMHTPSGTDKKIKAGLLKDVFRREYGYNLKVASLRLGEGFLFISYHEENSQFRVCLFEKQGNDSSDERYTLQFYIYNILQRSVLVPQMQQVRQSISDKFGDLVQSVFYQRKCRNTLLVLAPRVQDSKKAMEAGDGEQLQLKADIDNSNILNGPILKIRELQRAGFFVQQCVDVSLRAYITCLYLKNESMKIMLSVRQAVTQPIQVQTQSFLEKVDRLCKHKHVLQINPALQFDLKINELYYLYDLRKKLSFFNNGLLIYHKNRLLMRYKYPLGELLQRKYYKRPLCHNFLRLFGFIELPDHIPINFLKTSYLHHAMMERLFSRLKLISKLFKRELQRMAADPDYRRHAPSRLNQQEAQQEKNQTSEPKQPRRKSETAPGEISLRRTKTPQKDLLQGLQARMKQLLKDPTSENIKEIIKLVEANSGTKEELDYFHKNKYKLLGSLAPVGRPLSNKAAQIQRMRQAARIQAQAMQNGEADGYNSELKGSLQQKKQQQKEMLAQEMGLQQKNEHAMMDEGQMMMEQASSSSSDEQSKEEAMEMPQKQEADL